MFAGKKIWPELIALLVGGLVLTAACQTLAPRYEYKGNLFDPPIAVPDFELQAADGQPFRLSNIRGDFALIYFGYTFCPDVCPLTLADVKNALAGLGEEGSRVHLIFISIDPQRDTPETLARYLNGFDPAFIGLSDDFEKVQAVMKPYGAFAEKEDAAGSAAGYLMSHTARLYLVTPNGDLLLNYPFGFAAEDLQSDLAHLLAEQK